MKNKKGFKHLGANDRDRIHALYGNLHNQSDIAKVLNVNKGTISRELRRYSPKTWRYSATHAQKDAEEKRRKSKHQGKKIETCPSLKKDIIKQLKRLRSPDEIAGRLKRLDIIPRVGTVAIYKWLYSPYGKQYCRYLCTKRVKKRKHHRISQRVLIPERISFKERPESANLIHVEGDTFVSPRSSKLCGLIVVENSTKLLGGKIVPQRTRTLVVPAMRTIIKHITLDTCTLDNGLENIHHREFGVSVYFCDKGSPHQKPHIEQSIGLVRRWFLPKGTNLSEITDEVFQSQLHLLNHKYRKSLGYLSSYEVARARGIITRIPKIPLSMAVAFR